MTRYVLDTDHLSSYGRNHSSIVEQLRSAKVPLMTIAVNVDEQLRGRLAQVAEAKDRRPRTSLPKRDNPQPVGAVGKNLQDGVSLSGSVPIINLGVRFFIDESFTSLPAVSSVVLVFQ